MPKEEWTKKEIAELKKRAQSEYCAPFSSEIHGQGLYAKKAIKKGSRVIEYVGEKVGKEESERRSWAQVEHAEQTGDAAVYIFNLDDEFDIDGSVEWNIARLINHSCDPNCETWIEGDQIFVYAARGIAKGEELSFDYGFDIECYEDHPCRCSAENCKGYIVSQEQWEQLDELLKQKEGKKKKTG